MNAPIFQAIGASLLAIAIASCGPSTPGANGPAPAPEHKGVQHFYPLDEGFQWMYTVRDASLPAAQLASTKVVTFIDGEATLKTGESLEHLRITPDGIVRDPANAYLLKWPIHAGDRWPTEEGASMEVMSTDASVIVEAGEFKGCAQLRESFPDGSRIERTFCPEVGPVIIEAHSMSPTGEQITSARLRAYGQPQTLTK
jgi:hypothetical protein